MEKYYIAKLLGCQSDAFDHQQKVKLVEIHYARRPPSFGVVYLEQQQQQTQAAARDNQLSLKQHLNLATFELVDNHVAKFHVVKQTDLSSTNNADSHASANAPTPGFLIDFDTNKEILMETSSPQQQQQHFNSKADSDATGKQLPHCVALTDDGALFAVHLISGHVKRLTSACDKQQQLLASSRGSEANFLDCKLLNHSTDLMENYCLIYVLAERFYSVYKLTNDNMRECKLELNSSYSLQSSHHQFENSTKATTNTRGANLSTAYQRFLRMFVVESNPQVLLVELNDFSIKIFQNSTCLANVNLDDSLGLPTMSPRQHLILTRKSNDGAVLLSYSKTRVVMHSFRINLESDQQRSSNVAPTDLASQRYDHHINDNMMNDPDQLLPREPSFEIEMCWSIDLNDIDSIRSSDDADDDENDNREDGVNDGDEANGLVKANDDINKFLGSNQQASISGSRNNSSAGCLCSMWSSNQLNASNCWPKFLLITYKFHFLVYSFEQQPQLPFSVVYDKSFLKLVPMDETSSATTMPASLTVASSTKDISTQQEYIDVKLKPKLLHNFKLIGAQPSDSLFNTLFLVSKTRLIKQRHFPQLGLLISLSNSGDVMAFKFTSNKIITQKDGLYQQQICDSIRCDSLLKDQIEQIQVNNNLIRSDIESLEMQSNSAKSQLVERLDNLLLVELRHREQVGSLYDLKITLSNLVRVSRIFVTLTVDSQILKPNLINSSIQTIYIDNNAGICQSGCDTTTSANSPRLPGIVLASIGQGEMIIPDGGALDNDEDDEDNGDYDHEELILQKQQQLNYLNNDGNCGNDTSGGTNQCSPTGIKAWAMIELDSNNGDSGNNNLLLVKKSHIIQLILPLFVMDGQSGQVQVFYLLNSANHLDAPDSIRFNLTMFAESRLHQQQHKRSGRNSAENSILRFHSKSIQVKPLMSYKPSGLQSVPMLKTESNSNNSMVKLSISGLFKRTNMLEWLYECIPDELMNPQQQQRTQQHQQQSEPAVVIGDRLNSVFTHCFIDYEISENLVCLKSDDLIALEIIKKHILKKATDKSIKLDVNQSSPLNSTIMHSLRHLIELQYINLDICSRLMKESDARHKQRLERNATEELHSIMESLIGDKNQMDDFPIEITPSDEDWFERSLKQDLITLAGKFQASTLESKMADGIVDSEASILRDLVCNFICNILVEFDKLQGLRHSSEAIRTLRQRLTKSISEYDKISFVDRILNDWNESKKSQKI